LKDLLSSGKQLTEADERLMDQSANLVDEWRVLERIKEVGNVSRAATEFNKEQKATLEVLILKANQPSAIDAKAINSESTDFQLKV
jgi:hypothetical protein